MNSNPSEKIERIKFIVPIVSKKRWWEFWKENDSKRTKRILNEVMEKYGSPISADDTNVPLDYFIHVNDDKIDKVMRFDEYGNLLDECKS